MKVISGNTYTCENGYTVTVKSSSLPYYKFKVESAYDECGTQCDWLSEVWTEDGKAYHHDCGFNFKELP